MRGLFGIILLILSLAGIGHGLYHARVLEERWLTQGLRLHAEKIGHIATGYTQITEPNEAQSLTELSQKVAGLGLGAQVRHYSPYALDWRNQFETPFNTKAWNAIQANPTSMPSEMIEGAQGTTYHLAQGIFLSPTCQTCTFLNNKGETLALEPGQLLGVVEWEWPLNSFSKAYQKERALLQNHHWLQAGFILTLGLVAGLGCVFLLRRLRIYYDKKLSVFTEESQHYQRTLAQERVQHEENTQFTRIVSREIRTPVNSLLGLSELLLSEDLPAPHYEKLKLLEESAKEIAGILDNIMELKNIESDDSPLYPTKTHLRKLVGTLLTQFQSKVAQRQLTLLCHVDKKVPEYVQVDGHRIQQILNNLINNALQNTQRGGIAIEISAVDPAPNLIEIIFKVIDTGAGISESKIPYVFKQKQAEGLFVFSDEEQLRSRLIVCEKLVSKMGGNIGVNSTLDKGSTFWFTLQVAITAGAQEASSYTEIEDSLKPYHYTFDLPMDSERLLKLITQRGAEQQTITTPSKNTALQANASQSPLSILIVEDNAVNRMVATNILSKMGHSVQVASNGLEALQQVIDHDFDVVLMDIQMPEMNGVAATQEIRKLSDPKKSQVPIIALTADAMVGDKEKYLRAGLDGYVSKPFRADQLRQVIESIVPINQS